jgi:hypothetical protein
MPSKLGEWLQMELAMLEQKLGQRVLNDVHRLMVFESEPPPLFAKLGPPSLIRGIPRERFEKVFLYAIAHPSEISNRERLSLDLFNSSFFQRSAGARFLSLVMAVEALLRPCARSRAATEHVEHLTNLTRESESLLASERDSLLGSLRWLLQESINQTGRRLATERLGAHTYMDRDPVRFFSYVYNLRSQLVHGSTSYPSHDVISSVVAALEGYVSDMLSGPLLEVEL